MLFTSVLLLLLTLISLSSPTLNQDISGLPSCATNCLAASLRSSARTCTPTDFACLCRNSEFVSTSNSCYASSCSATDLATAQQWGIKSCAAAGVQININNSTTTTDPSTPNSVPVNNTTTPARPNTAVTVSPETIKLLTIGASLLSCLLIIG